MAIILLFAVMLFLGAIVKEKQSAFILKLCFVSLFFFTMFRGIDMGGTDVITYQAFFYSGEVTTIPQFDWKFWTYSNSFRFSWGYTLLNVIAKTIWDNYLSFQILNTILVFSLFAIVLKKISVTYKEKCFFFFIYYCYEFYWYFFGLLRQNVANLIIWIVLLDFINGRFEFNKKSLFKSVFLLFVAYMFHPTAIFVLTVIPFVIVINKWKSDVKYYALGFLSLIIYFFSEGIMANLGYLLGLFFGDRYLRYSTAGGANVINYLLKIAFLFIMIYLSEDKDKMRKNADITLFAILVGSLNSTVTLRIVEYFAIGYYTGFPKTVYEQKRAKNYYLLLGSSFFIFIVILIRFVYFNAPYLLNYSFYKL